VPVAQYEAYRATAQYVSPDGETIQFLTGLTADRAAVPDRLGGAVVLRGPRALRDLVHQDRRGQRPDLHPAVPDVIFLLALGEDYNILVMSRIREEAHHLPLREAVSRALGATGTTVTSAGLVLAGTFAVFALVGGRGSGGNQIRDVGVGLGSAC
jgi:hypothetical protein